MALGIIFAVAYIFFLRTPPPVPTPELRAITGSYRLERSLAADQPGATPRPAASGSFAASASGDAAGTMRPSPSPTRRDDPRPLRSSYDAKLRATLTTATFLGRDITTRTVDAWPPAWRVATPSPLDYQGLAAIVRSAVEDKDRAIGIKPLKDRGRTVWRAAMTFADDDLVEVVVDQQTGLVLWHSETERGSTETFTAAPVWGPTPSPSPPAVLGAASASYGSPAAAQTRRDPTYTYVPSLDAAGRAAGYVPLAPTLVPDGFAVRAMATAAPMGAPGTWLGDEPVSSPVGVDHGERQVDVLYTRGLTWFTIRQLGPRSAQTWANLIRDVLASGGSARLSFETAPLQYGAFAGSTACTWYEKSGPSLLVGDGRAVVYATGALTRQELITLAEGLERPGDAASASPSAAR